MSVPVILVRGGSGLGCPQSDSSSLQFVVRQERLQLLAKTLYWASGAVLVFSLIGGIFLLTTDSDALLVGEVQDENRTFAAFASIIGGVSAAGVLAALAGILDLLLSRGLDG
jgi:hypothetical protein